MTGCWGPVRWDQAGTEWVLVLPVWALRGRWGCILKVTRSKGKAFLNIMAPLNLSFRKTKCLQLLHLALCPWDLSPLLAQNLLFRVFLTQIWSDFPGDARDKEATCQCRGYQRHSFDPRVGKIPWRRKWQRTSIFLPGESHGQRSLAGCNPWGHKESDTTEAT